MLPQKIVSRNGNGEWCRKSTTLSETKDSHPKKVTEPSKRLPNNAFPLRVTRTRYRHPIAGELLDDLDESVDKLRENSDDRRVQHRLRTRTTDLSLNSVKRGLPKAL
jgi:hypothetical protein